MLSLTHTLASLITYKGPSPGKDVIKHQMRAHNLQREYIGMTINLREIATRRIILHVVGVQATKKFNHDCH